MQIGRIKKYCSLSNIINGCMSVIFNSISFCREFSEEQVSLLLIKGKPNKELQQMWNASRFCMSFFRMVHAKLKPPLLFYSGLFI